MVKPTHVLAVGNLTVRETWEWGFVGKILQMDCIMLAVDSDQHVLTAC